MDVLFKNIPIGIRDFELTEFIEQHCHVNRSSTNRYSLSICQINMLELQDNFTHPIEQFALVKVSCVEVAKELIQQLNGLIFNQCQITVRQFYHRSEANDPRKKNAQVEKKYIDRRVKDRRQSSLVLSRRV